MNSTSIMMRSPRLSSSFVVEHLQFLVRRCQVCGTLTGNRIRNLAINGRSRLAGIRDKRRLGIGSSFVPAAASAARPPEAMGILLPR
jgi:hypothetical protein